MRNLLAILFVFAAAIPARAQVAPAGSNGEVPVDRVIAVVGDTALLSSDLQNEINRYRAGGFEIPEDPAALEEMIQEILEAKIDELIVVSAARDQGLSVPEDVVTQMTDQQIARVQQQFGSEPAFTAALARDGSTRERYRQELSAMFRDQQLRNEYLRSRLQNRARPVVDESQIREAFESQSGNQEQRPATVSFRQVVIAPEASPESKAAATARAEEVLAELRSGADFEVLARRFSDDVGTREHGGDLGWFTTGRMVAEFERAVFSMRRGETSGIVESPFGLHIIRLDRTRGAERQARHILIQPEITEADVARARERADSVAAAVRSGASIAELAARYNDPSDRATVNLAVVEGLAPELRTAVDGVEVGDIVGPVEVADPRGNRWVVLSITENTPPRDYTLEDVRDQIQESLQFQQMEQQLLQELREQYYVNILL